MLLIRDLKRFFIWLRRYPKF